jgi:molybdopterin converting factor small subunit
MSIEIELFGQLIPHCQRRQSWEIKNPVPIHEVMDKLGLKDEEIGLISVNGVLSEPDDLVHPGSRLCFFPHMSGG